MMLESIGDAFLNIELVACHVVMLAHLITAALYVSIVAAESGGRLVRDCSAKRGMPYASAARVVLSQAAVQLPE